MIINSLKNKKVLLVGYGVDGKATETYLRARIPDLDLTIADESDGLRYLNTQKSYDMAIVSPGVPKSRIQIPWTTSANIFFEECRGIVVGVTGTKGKSTTAKLIYEILRTGGRNTSLIGNIGTPLLEELDDINAPDYIFVCELSSYQLEGCTASPHIAVVTALYPDHIPHHGTVENYYAAKSNITRHQVQLDHLIYAKDNRIVETWKTEAKRHRVQKTYHEFNREAARVTARLLAIPEATISKALKEFQGLPHRLEKIGIYQNIAFYDDGAATVPEATIEALKALDDVDTLFVGGEDRGYDFDQLVSVIVEKGVRNIALFPDTGRIIGQKLQEKGSFNFLDTTSMKEAVAWAYVNTSPGGVCLLSSASPSYSLWKDFNEKGEEYAHWVRELKR